MGKKTWGGYFPEQYPSSSEVPASTNGVIPGVFYIDDVRLFLDGSTYTSTIDANKIISPPHRPCRSNAAIWPQSLFTLVSTTPADADVQCNSSFIDFEPIAYPGSVDYGYGFKMYWEKQSPGSTSWVPVLSPPVLLSNKIRLGHTLWTNTDSYDAVNGQFAMFRFSSSARYATTTTITVPLISNVPDNDTLALMPFSTSVTAVFVPAGTTAPTVSTRNNPSLTTNDPPSGQNQSLVVALAGYWAEHRQSVTLTSDSFMRNTGDFCVETYFRWTSVFSDFNTILDTRPNDDNGKAENPDAFAIHIRNNRLVVTRGNAIVIADKETFLFDTWYHLILTCENQVWRLYKTPLAGLGMPTSQATLVGAPFTGEHTPRLRLRGADIAVSENGTKYRAKVKYGALRQLTSRAAELEVITPEITEWIIQIDLLLVDAADILNQRHLLDDEGTGYPPGAGHEVRLDVEIESTVASNQFKFGWEIATQILSDTLDPERESFFIGSPASDGGGYTPQQVYDWIAGEDLAVAEGLTPEEYWAGATTTNPAVPVVPELEWTTRRPPQPNPEVPPFVIESFFDKNFLAYRPYAICGTQRITGPVAFIQKATT